MNIALFGGSFDPPHLAHHRVVTEILDQQLVDQVWYVLAKKHPFGKQLNSDEHRLQMLQLLMQDVPHDRLRIETYELHQTEVSYSFNTIEYFATTQPEHTFSWIIGSDNVAHFPKWHKAEEFLHKYRVWVYPRTHYEIETLPAGMKLLSNVQEVDISSSHVRSRIVSHHSITGLVSPSVEEYIVEHGLYQ